MRRFEFSDGKSNKFWEISQQGAELTVRFGRLGANGTSQTKSFAEAARAETELNKLVREKTGKGYREVDGAASSPAPAAPLSTVELESLADLVGTAAEEYAEHSCNDYEVADSAANRLVLAAAIEHNRDRGDGEPMETGPDSKGMLFVFDDWLMRYLAHRCREVLAASAAERLAEAELLLLADIVTEMSENNWDAYDEDEGEFSLQASEESRALLASATREGRRSGWQDRLTAIAEAGDLASALTLDVLAWLARRCRAAVGQAASALPAVAAASPQAAAAMSPARPGVLKSWISEKSLVKRATELDVEWLPEYRRNEADLQTYAGGGNPFREYEDKDVPASSPFASRVAGLLQTARAESVRAVVLSMFGSRTDMGWQQPLDRAVAISFWRWRVMAHYVGRIDVDDIVAVLVDCLALGCMKEAESLARLLHWAIRHGKYRGNALATGSLPLYHWMLRLCFEHWELECDLAACAAGAPVKDPFAKGGIFGEPVLNELLRHWRDPDLSPLQEQLLWLCDYYTQRTAYRDALGQRTEFGNEWIPCRYPAAILAWFRLRESRGLQNPAIDHPLMQPRYAKLLAPRPLHRDPLVEQMIDRLRCEELTQLADLDDSSLNPPERPAKPDPRTTGPFAAIELNEIWNEALGLRVFHPLAWVERSLPELLRFREPQTGTEFAFSGYRNPGMSYRQWAEARFAAYTAAVPQMQRVRERYEVVGRIWWGFAEEFRGLPPGASTPVHQIVLCCKSPKRLLSLTITATPEAFAVHGDFYRWFMQWQLFPGEIAAEHFQLPAWQQDLAGFARVPVWGEALSRDDQFNIGVDHYNGWGDSEEERASRVDRPLAAEWFERAARLGYAEAQYVLAGMLGDGDGVAKDLSQAIVWCRRAVDGRHEKAPGRLAELEAASKPKASRWKLW